MRGVVKYDSSKKLKRLGLSTYEKTCLLKVGLFLFWMFRLSHWFILSDFMGKEMAAIIRGSDG